MEVPRSSQYFACVLTSALSQTAVEYVLRRLSVADEVVQPLGSIEGSVKLSTIIACGIAD